MVIVGAESVVENGGIVSLIGTFQIAMVAKVRKGLVVRPVFCCSVLSVYTYSSSNTYIYVYGYGCALLCWFRNLINRSTLRLRVTSLPGFTPSISKTSLPEVCRLSPFHPQRSMVMMQ